MPPKEPRLQHTVTQLLGRYASGNAQALEELMPLVYGELLRLAGRYMRSERIDHTLQKTALVHEAYMELVDANVSWNDRTHFFALAAQAMRRILVDHARARGRDKRGGDLQKVEIEDNIPAASKATVDILDLDSALQKLAALDPRQSKVVELRYFGEMTHDEIAEITGLSATSVDRELRLARAWMNRELRGLGPKGYSL